MKRMNIIRQISAVLVVCALSVCLFAGCGPAEPLAGDETTTATDTVTTTLGDTSASDSASSFDTTGSQTVTPSNSAQPSQEATTTPSAITTTTTAPKTPGATADVSGIFIGGKALSDFKVGTKNYTYYLDAGTTTAPQVTASKTAGTGEITITQAANANGTAKVTLNGTTYTIQFVVRRSEMDRLNNTYYQLKVAKKLNVAYLGGSVTDGYGSTSK
ncbi:MAG: hypothetical protein IKU56_01635, partial [Clostridia bacterium]|nr:hypothetical protein [Clostridia bacterium]